MQAVELREDGEIPTAASEEAAPLENGSQIEGNLKPSAGDAKELNIKEEQEEGEGQEEREEEKEGGEEGEEKDEGQEGEEEKDGAEEEEGDDDEDQEEEDEGEEEEEDGDEQQPDDGGPSCSSVSPTALGRNRRVRQKNRYFLDFHCIDLTKGVRSKEDFSYSQAANIRSTTRRSTTDSSRGQQEDQDVSVETKYCRKCSTRTAHDCDSGGCQVCLYKKIVSSYKRQRPASSKRSNNRKADSKSKSQQQEEQQSNNTDGNVPPASVGKTNSKKKKYTRKSGGGGSRSTTKISKDNTNSSRVDNSKIIDDTGADITAENINSTTTIATTTTQAAFTTTATPIVENNITTKDNITIANNNHGHSNNNNNNSNPTSNSNKTIFVSDRLQSALTSAPDSNRLTLKISTKIKSTNSCDNEQESKKLKIAKLESKIIDNETSESSTTLKQGGGTSNNQQTNETPQIDAWTPDEVARYIMSRGFVDEAELFKSESVDGISLLLMQRADFTYGLKLKLGPALKIYDQVCKLKKEYFRKVTAAS